MGWFDGDTKRLEVIDKKIDRMLQSFRKTIPEARAYAIYSQAEFIALKDNPTEMQRRLQFIAYALDVEIQADNVTEALEMIYAKHGYYITVQRLLQKGLDQYILNYRQEITDNWSLGQKKLAEIQRKYSHKDYFSVVGPEDLIKDYRRFLEAEYSKLVKRLDMAKYIFENADYAELDVGDLQEIFVECITNISINFLPAQHPLSRFNRLNFDKFDPASISKSEANHIIKEIKNCHYGALTPNAVQQHVMERSQNIVNMLHQQYLHIQSKGGSDCPTYAIYNELLDASKQWIAFHKKMRTADAAIIKEALESYREAYRSFSAANKKRFPLLLCNLDLSHKILNNANFSFYTLENCQFIGSNLDDANFNSCTFKNVNFKEADVRSIVFTKYQIKNSQNLDAAANLDPAVKAYFADIYHRKQARIYRTFHRVATSKLYHDINFGHIKYRERNTATLGQDNCQRLLDEIETKSVALASMPTDSGAMFYREAIAKMRLSLQVLLQHPGDDRNKKLLCDGLAKIYMHLNSHMILWTDYAGSSYSNVGLQQDLTETQAKIGVAFNEYAKLQLAAFKTGELIRDNALVKKSWLKNNIIRMKKLLGPTSESLISRYNKSFSGYQGQQAQLEKILQHYKNLPDCYKVEEYENVLTAAIKIQELLQAYPGNLQIFQKAIAYLHEQVRALGMGLIEHPELLQKHDGRYSAEMVDLLNMSQKVTGKNHLTEADLRNIFHKHITVVIEVPEAPRQILPDVRPLPQFVTAHTSTEEPLPEKIGFWKSLYLQLLKLLSDIWTALESWWNKCDRQDAKVTPAVVQDKQFYAKEQALVPSSIVMLRTNQSQGISRFP